MVSMYARWLTPHPSTKSRWSVGYSDASAHRIISDLSAFIGHRDPATHRILAAGDLNMFYGATGGTLSLPARDRTVWERMQALGMEFLGPQVPHGRPRVADDEPSSACPWPAASARPVAACTAIADRPVRVGWARPAAHRRAVSGHRCLPARGREPVPRGTRALTRWCVARGGGAARGAGWPGARAHAASPVRAAPDRRQADPRPRAVPVR